MEIGERIREARKKCGLTQKQLAEKLNISYQQIGQYEKGTRRPKSENLQKIADALGVNIDYLYGKTRIDTFTKTFLNEYPAIEKAFSSYIRDVIAKYINISPEHQKYLEKIGKMHFDDLSADEKIVLYNIIFDHITYSEDTNTLDIYLAIPDSDKTSELDQNIIENYSKLNDAGKEEASKRIQELTEIKKYTDQL